MELEVKVTSKNKTRFLKITRSGPSGSIVKKEYNVKMSSLHGFIMTEDDNYEDFSIIMVVGSEDYMLFTHNDKEKVRTIYQSFLDVLYGTSNGFSATLYSAE